MDERGLRFARLFASAYGPVWAYARRRVPVADLDDVVAEVFTVAWRRLDAVPDGDGALPWLYRVAYRTIGNHRRAGRRRLRLIRRLEAEPPLGGAPETGSVLEVLGTLSARDQEVLRLSAWEGLQPKEIAVVLGCSANAAALRLSRARTNLRNALTGSDASRTHPQGKEIDA